MDANCFRKLEDLDEEEIDSLLELNVNNSEFDIDDVETMDSIDKLIDLKAELDVKREEYTDFYDSYVKGIVENFISDYDLDGALLYEARIKQDVSVKNSLERKDIKLDELKDYLGMRFVADTKEDAYTLAGLFMINCCIPKDRDEYKSGDEYRFNVYQTRDYFKRPKLDEKGEIQYSGIHIFLEKNGKKFELQVHDLDSYEKANLTHDEYKTRKTTSRTTVEFEIDDAFGLN